MMLMQAATPCSTSVLAISSATAWLGQVQSVTRVEVGIAQRYRIMGVVVSGYRSGYGICSARNVLKL